MSAVEQSSCERSINIFFDILAALISISDVATDVIVTYNFYINDQMTFFGLSLTFIILAQLSYCFAFLIVIASEDSPCRAFLLFLCLLPISPVLSFIFFLTEDPNSPTSEFLKEYMWFNVSLGETYIDKTKSKLRQWMKKKLRKHMGFIMESCIEAFPQSIIQISAIVVYNNADVISIVSILISMLSVSSKAFIFAVQFSINLKSLLFLWISAVTDFIGIFFAISWVLYDTDNETILLLADIWMYKIIVCVVPLVFCASIFFYVNGLEELLNAMYSSSRIAKCFGGCCAWLMVQILWAFGMVLGTMGLEIATFITWTPPIMLACDRLPHNGDTAKKFFETYKWIMHGHRQNIEGEMKLSKKQDRIIRTCVVNKVLESQLYSSMDPQFKAFIDQQEKTSFINVKSWNMLRIQNTEKDLYKDDWSQFYQVAMALLAVPHIIAHNEAKYVHGETKKKIIKYGVGFANFGIAPFYYLSRIFNMIFPFLILINLYSDGYDIFDRNDIHLFQCIMLLLYLFFILMLLILAIICYREHFYLWHLQPGKNIPNSTAIDLNNVMKKYDEMISVPVRNALLKKKYGPDIAKIVIYYCDNIEVDLKEMQETNKLLEYH